jgi:Zn-dependent peptidase ImmA (M78 family)
MAHEVGHCLLHSHLFAMSAGTQSLFGPDSDVVGSKVLCRDEVGGRSTVNHGRYDGRWWEFQANQVMGAILLPKRLVLQCLDPYLCVQGKLGMKVFNSSRREEAVRQLAEVFDVNPAVVRLRLNGLYPLNREANQLSL